jgi:hypothetical protein
MARTLIIELIRDLRQICYPQAFRIASGSPGESVHAVEPAIQSFLKAAASLSDPDFLRNSTGSSVADEDRFLADLATRVWRIRHSMWKPGGQEPYAEVSRSYRHVERLMAALEDLGIVISDKTGDAYDPGLSVRVLSTEPVENIHGEVIKETLSPTVYRKGRLIQQAQIVVGTPAKSSPTMEGGPVDDNG